MSSRTRADCSVSSPRRAPEASRSYLRGRTPGHERGWSWCKVALLLPALQRAEQKHVGHGRRGDHTEAERDPRVRPRARIHGIASARGTALIIDPCLGTTGSVERVAEPCLPRIAKLAAPAPRFPCRHGCRISRPACRWSRAAARRLYVRSLSGRNRRPRAGSGGGPAKRYVRSSTTATTSRRRSSCRGPKTDRERTVDAAALAAHASSCRLAEVWSAIERAPRISAVVGVRDSTAR